MLEQQKKNTHNSINQPSSSQLYSTALKSLTLQQKKSQTLQRKQKKAIHHKSLYEEPQYAQPKTTFLQKKSSQPHQYINRCLSDPELSMQLQDIEEQQPFQKTQQIPYNIIKYAKTKFQNAKTGVGLNSRNEVRLQEQQTTQKQQYSITQNSVLTQGSYSSLPQSMSSNNNKQANDQGKGVFSPSKLLQSTSVVKQPSKVIIIPEEQSLTCMTKASPTSLSMSTRQVKPPLKTQSSIQTTKLQMKQKEQLDPSTKFNQIKTQIQQRKDHLTQYTVQDEYITTKNALEEINEYKELQEHDLDTVRTIIGDFPSSKTQPIKFRDTTPTKHIQQKHDHTNHNSNSRIKERQAYTIIDSSLRQSRQERAQHADNLIKSKVLKQNRFTTQGYDDCDGSSIFNENPVKESVAGRSSKKSLLKDLQIEKTAQQFMSLSPSGSHQKLHLLLELNLRLANMKEISGKLFQANLYLRCIDLRNNKISKIPDNICELPNLWKIRLDYNYLTELPEQIGSLNKLEYFTASQNRLTSLPQSLFKLGASLSVLQLNDNRLTFLPNALGSLTLLKSLLLHNNYFVQLPSSIYNLSQLNELSLDWFQYMDCFRSITKMQKDQAGLLIIKEFLNTCRLVHKVISDLENDDQQIHFTHFLMYILKLQSLAEIPQLRYLPKNRSLIHLFSVNGHLYLLKELLVYCDRININAEDDEQSTPFILAMKNKRHDMIKFFISLPQTNVNKGSIKYGYPLHIAIQTQEFKLAIKLLKNKKNDQYRYIDVNQVNEEGNNALHFVFLNFYSNPQLSGAIVKNLIKKGININAKNKNELTPLHLAVLSNQIEALQYAIDYNKRMREYQASSESQNSDKEYTLNLFSFNCQGGKQDWNVLHLVVQSNNMRLISTLLQSDENIDFLALDADGKTPKDLSPFNSPVYKLLIKFQQERLRRHYEDSAGSVGLSNQNDLDVVHYYVSKRNYESPQSIRQKIIDQAKKRDAQKSQYDNRRQGSQQRGRPAAYSQHRDANSLARKNSHVSKHIDAKSVTHNRKYSTSDSMTYQEFKQAQMKKQEVQDKNFLMIKQIKNPLEESSLLDDYNLSILEYRGSPKQGQVNSVKGSILHNNLKSFLSQENQQVPLYTDCFRKSFLNQPLIKSDVSSPNVSFYSNSKSRRQSAMEGNDFISPKALNSRTSNTVPITAQRPDRCNRVQASKDQVIRISNEESVIKEFINDEEDDANVPEDENDHINQKQAERPLSQLRSLHQAQSVIGFDNSPEKEKQRLIYNIIEQVQIQRQKNSQLDKQALISQYASVSMPITTLPVNKLLKSESAPFDICYQEQGCEGDVSSLLVVQEDIASIQQPKDEQFSPKFATSISKYNLQSRLNEESDHKNVTTVQVKTWHHYSRFFYNLSKQVSKRMSALDATKVNTINLVPNQNDTISYMFYIDQAYYLQHRGTLAQIEQTLKQVSHMKIEIPQNITINIKDFLIYELINTLNIKNQQIKHFNTIYKSIDQLQHELIDESLPKKTHKNFQKSPSFKAQIKKAPSVSTLFQDTPNKQAPNTLQHQRQPLQLTDRSSSALFSAVATPKTIPHHLSSAYSLSQKILFEQASSKNSSFVTPLSQNEQSTPNALSMNNRCDSNYGFDKMWNKKEEQITITQNQKGIPIIQTILQNNLQRQSKPDKIDQQAQKPSKKQSSCHLKYKQSASFKKQQSTAGGKTTNFQNSVDASATLQQISRTKTERANHAIKMNTYQKDKVVTISIQKLEGSNKDQSESINSSIDTMIKAGTRNGQQSIKSSNMPIAKTIMLSDVIADTLKSSVTIQPKQSTSQYSSKTISSRINARDKQFQDTLTIKNNKQIEVLAQGPISQTLNLDSSESGRNSTLTIQSVKQNHQFKMSRIGQNAVQKNTMFRNGELANKTTETQQNKNYVPYKVRQTQQSPLRLDTRNNLNKMLSPRGQYMRRQSSPTGDSNRINSRQSKTITQNDTQKKQPRINKVL